MSDDYEKLFSKLKSVEPGTGLFDRIILAIQREQKLYQTRKIFFGFLALLVISLAAVPFSVIMLINQIKDSGFYYFVSAALSNLGIFMSSWQSFSLAILEALPILGIIAFIVSAGLVLWTVRLFLHRKRILFGYLRQGLI